MGSTTYTLKCKIPVFSSQAAWSKNGSPMSSCFFFGCLTPSVPPYSFRCDASAIYVHYSILAAVENGIQWTCEHVGETSATFVVQIDYGM